MPEHVVHCCVCMVNFHSRERLLNHLRYRSEVCKINLVLQRHPMSSDDADKIDEKLRPKHVKMHAKGDRRYYGHLPASRLDGPLPFAVRDPSKISKHHVLGMGRNNG